MRLVPTLIVAILSGLVSAAAPAANLVDNGGFDDDVSDWLPLLGSSIEHSSTDELGSPTSGSLLAQTEQVGQTATGALVCVPAVAGKTYVFGAVARLAEDQPGSSASVSIDWYPNTTCSGGPIDAATGEAYRMTVRGAWGPTQRWGTAPPGANSGFLRISAFAFDPPETKFRVEIDNVFFLEDATCATTPTVMCLNQDRFRVIAQWRTKAGDEGFGRARPLTDDSGYFWFFNSANVELVTKLLDACPTQFDRFWFFAAGLTNVETILRVHDTATDTERVYQNAQEVAFAPIQDANAFDTCP